MPLSERLAQWKSRIKGSSRASGTVAGIGFLIVAILTSTVLFATGPNPKPTEKTEKAWPVSTVEVTPDSLRPSYRTYGRVESAEIASLGVDVVARVAAVQVQEGQWVERGATLLMLETRELGLRLREAEANRAQAEAQLASLHTEAESTRALTEHYGAMHRIAQAKLERHEDLFAQRMIAQSLRDEVVQQASERTIEYQRHLRAVADLPNRIQQQRAMVSQAAASVEQAMINLDKANLVAPFSGPVIDVAAAPGDTTQPGRLLVKMASSDAFQVRTQVPESQARRFRLADETQTVIAQATINGQRVALPLDRLSVNVRDGQSGLDAFFSPPRDAFVEVGRVLDLEVTLPVEANVVAVPVQSLYENDRIYRVVDDRLDAVSVERVGEYLDAGSYRVLVRSSDLGQGETVITTQLPKAVTGLLVETRESMVEGPSALAKSG